MKILVHAHTTYSNDGDLSPQELADVARRRGFQGVLVSDHFESLTEDRFYKLVEECASIQTCLMIPGYERSWRGFHILALGAYQWFDDPNLPAWSENVRAGGGIIVMAHPTRYKHRIPADILEACDAVEVWNSKPAYDGILGPNPRGFRLLGTNRFPLCSQDLHGVRHASSVGVELEKTCSGRDQILACLKRGEYRMTNGLLHFGQTLPVQTSVVLNLMHTFRRRAVDCAIKMRRALLSRRRQKSVAYTRAEKYP